MVPKASARTANFDRSAGRGKARGMPAAGVQARPHEPRGLRTPNSSFVGGRREPPDGLPHGSVDRNINSVDELLSVRAQIFVSETLM